MSRVVIEIDDDKTVWPIIRVTVNGEVLSCIQDMHVLAGSDGRPESQITFADAPEGLDCARKAAKGKA